MQNATEIARHVAEELRWTPEIDATDTAVKVTDGATDSRSDADIARSAADAIEREFLRSPHLIRISVRDGEVTLEGLVDWGHQRTRAADAVASVCGVKRVSNLIVTHDIAWSAPGGTQVKNHF
jgi:osmotically-inducible protein OsmY